MATIEPYLREIRNDLLRDLARKGFTQAQLARIFNLNRATILRILEVEPQVEK